MELTQSSQELKRHLEEHIQFLLSSADAFDRGFEGEAKRLAVSLRVLLHDTRGSKSLFGQLGEKDRLFVDTSTPVQEDSLSSHCGLAMISATNSGAKYVPMLDTAIMGTNRCIPFEEWWNATIFVDKNRRRMSRKDLILSMADQDGGAHVDPSLNEKYGAVSRQNALGWVQSNGKVDRPLQGPEKASVRQISHEVLKTLLPEYSKAGPDSPAGGTIFGGEAFFSLPQGTTKDEIEALMRKRFPIPKSNDADNQNRKSKIGRNGPCPCGSGKKYKNCCLHQ
jgi:hypothetical protein